MFSQSANARNAIVNEHGDLVAWIQDPFATPQIIQPILDALNHTPAERELALEAIIAGLQKSVEDAHTLAQREHNRASQALRLVSSL